MIVTRQRNVLFRKPTKEHKDTKLLKSINKYLRFTGITPLTLNSSRSWPKVWSSLLLILMLLYNYYCLSTWRNEIEDFSSDILLKVMLIFNFPFFGVCLVAANFRIQEWKEFMNSIHQLEEFITECGFQPGRLRILYISYVFGLSACFCEMSGFYYLGLVSRPDLWHFVSHSPCWMIYYVYRILLLSYFTYLAHFLKRRYLYLNEMLSLEMLSEDIIKKTWKILGMLHATVKYVNLLLGMHVFLLIGLFVLQYVGILSNVIVTGEVVNSGIYCIPSTTISLVVLVMSCDSLEKSGKKIIKTCYMLHESVGNEIIKEELFLLASYAEQWKPSLSAAGFYNLNQSTLSTLFEAIITYLVIIIQFNLALA